MNIQTQPSLQRTLPQATGTRPQKSTEEPASGPDLVVDRIIPSNGFPRAGDPVWFDVIVKNRGNEAAGSFTMQISAQGLRQDARAQQGLAAGAQVAFRSLGPLWTNMGDSLIWVEAKADTRNEVRETREDNNWMQTTLNVSSPFPPSPPFPPHPPHFPPH